MRKRMKAALGLLAAVLFTGAVPVSDAETPELYMQAEYVKESDKEIQADCMVKNGDSVTNGKVRIFYDAEKVKLVSSEAGKEGPQTSVPGESDKDEDKDEDKDKDKDTDKDKGGSSKKPNKVKTGDETEVGTYVALGAGTGLIILICAATAVKKRKKNQ